jgi:cyanophycinase
LIQSREERGSTRRGYVVAIGGAEDHDNDAVILRRFSAICGADAARLVIIPTASTRTDTGERYVRLFRNFGVRDVTTLALRRRPEAYEAEPLAAIGRATGVLFTGGDQLRLHRVIYDTPFADGLKARNAVGLHVAGTSAGAAFLCAQMIVRGKRGATPRTGMVTVEPGLGLTDHIIIDQHFRQRDRLGRLLTALSRYPVEVGIGVDEDTAAFLDADDLITVVGSSAVTVVDASRLVVSSSDSADEGNPVSLIGTTVHVLAEGGRYDVRRHEAEFDGANRVREPTP